MEIVDIEARLDWAKVRGVVVREVLCSDPRLVDIVEENLETRLPKELRSFYSHFEYLQIETDEIVWLRDLSELRSRLRTSSPWLSSSLVPVLSDGTGGYYYVVSRNMAEDDFKEGDVLHNPSGIRGLMEPANMGFFEFLAHRIDRAINLFGPDS